MDADQLTHHVLRTLVVVTLVSLVAFAAVMVAGGSIWIALLAAVVVAALVYLVRALDAARRGMP